MKNEGPEALPAYIPLIEKYTLDLLELCDDSEKLSRELVSNWLRLYMLKGTERFEGQVAKTVDFFSDYDKHLLHSRPLIIEKLKEFNLNITQADQILADLIWEAYILINGFFALTPFVKLYENIHGVSWGKHFQIFLQQPPQGIPPVKSVGP